MEINNNAPPSWQNRLISFLGMLKLMFLDIWLHSSTYNFSDPPSSLFKVFAAFSFQVSFGVIKDLHYYFQGSFAVIQPPVAILECQIMK